MKCFLHDRFFHGQSVLQRFCSAANCGKQQSHERVQVLHVRLTGTDQLQRFRTSKARTCRKRCNQLCVSFYSGNTKELGSAATQPVSNTTGERGHRLKWRKAQCQQKGCLRGPTKQRDQLDDSTHQKQPCMVAADSDAPFQKAAQLHGAEAPGTALSSSSLVGSGESSSQMQQEVGGTARSQAVQHVHPRSQAALALPATHGAPDGGPGACWVRPVFRSAPYAAELAKQRQPPADTVRVLILDEGNSCRSVLAQAVMRYMLDRLRKSIRVVVECASIGEPAQGPVDPRVVRIAREMALPLQPRCPREFDELEDAVQYDLVLVMDEFDLQEVLKEVAVVERINPQGLYSSRVCRLGSFGAASLRSIPGQLVDDIPDPLYGTTNGVAEAAALRATVHKLAFACRGLIHSLAQLRARSGPGMTLRRALAVSLQCPLLNPAVLRGRERLQEQWRPVWKQGGGLYTIRWQGQRRHVVRRGSGGRRRGYWKDPANVEAELRRWMAEAGVTHHLPTQQQLRASGANTLAASIGTLGGLAEFARRMGVPLAARHPNGFWDSFANLAAELAPFMQAGEGDGPHSSGAAGGEGARRPAQPSRLQGQPDPLPPSLLGAAPRPRKGSVGAGAAGPSLGSRGEGAGGGKAVGGQRLPASPVSLRGSPPSPRCRPVLPKQQQLIAAGRYDLVYAIRRHGGRAEVAARLGADLAHAPIQGSDQVCQQLLCFARDQAQRAQQGPAAATPPVAIADAGAARQRPSSSPARSPAWVGRTKGGALDEVGGTANGTTPSPLVMPSKAELYMAGRAELAVAVTRFGGFKYFARLLGLPREEQAVPAVRSAVQGVQEGGGDLRLPCFNMGVRGGGPVGVGSSSPPVGGVSCSWPWGDKGGWGRGWGEHGQERVSSAASLRPSALHVQPGGGEPGQSSHLGGGNPCGGVPGSGGVGAGASGAAAATAVHGGAANSQDSQFLAADACPCQKGGDTVPAHAPSSPPRSPSSTFMPPRGSTGEVVAGPSPSACPPPPASYPPPPMVVNVGQAVLEFMRSSGVHPGTLPSRQQLLRAGRRDLVNAVQRCGGGRRLAEHLGLEFQEVRGRKAKHAQRDAAGPCRHARSELADEFVLV